MSTHQHAPTAFTVTRTDQLCTAGMEPIPAGATAYENSDGWVQCTTHTVSAYADRIMTAIDADIAAGFVPAGVASFSALHDHVDANTYVIDVGLGDTFSDAETAMANAVMTEVDRRLRARNGHQS